MGTALLKPSFQYQSETAQIPALQQSNYLFRENISKQGKSKQINLNTISAMKFALALCLIGLKAAQAVAPFELVVEEWETWKVRHGKDYAAKNYGDNLKEGGMGGNYGQEEKFRMKIWMENKAKIEKHNRHAFKGVHSYHLAMNEWGDLLHHEFVATVNGYKARPANYSGELPKGAKYLMPAHTETLPENVGPSLPPEPWRPCITAPQGSWSACPSRTWWTAAQSTATRAVTEDLWTLPSSTSRTTAVSTLKRAIHMKERMTSADIIPRLEEPLILGSWMLILVTRLRSRQPSPPRDHAVSP